MKKKIIMTCLLFISLSTMCFQWFGGKSGVQDISGLILLHNPIAVTCIVLSFIGIWECFKENSYILTCIGLLGIALMEIYEFLTWHILTITGHFDLQVSFHQCYPYFFIALLCTLATFFIYQSYFQKSDLTN